MSKKIVLLSNKLFHYRVSIYNQLQKVIREDDIVLDVITNQIETSNPNTPLFNLHEEPFSFFSWKNLIKKTQPDAVVIFMHLKNRIMWPLIWWLKFRSIPIIYWNHGVNLQDADNRWKYVLFNYLHSISDAIILYSKNEIKYIREKNRHKLFIAPNALNENDFPEIIDTPADLRKKHNIPWKKMVLFVGRIEPQKKLERLIEIFYSGEIDNTGLIVIGSVEPGYHIELPKSPKIIYKGAIYDPKTISEYFKLADLFCLPGSVGLSVNQAMFWGTPVVTTDVIHHPEAIYIKNGKNGFIVEKDRLDLLKTAISELLENQEKLNEFSHHAREVIRNEGSIENMIRGFRECFQYVLYGRQ